MINGDEGKRMNLLEYISDEPVDCEPYLEYEIKNQRAHYEYWRDLPNDRDPERPTARECVLQHIDGFIITLEDVLMKLRRERKNFPIISDPRVSRIDADCVACKTPLRAINTTKGSYLMQCQTCQRVYVLNDL